MSNVNGGHVLIRSMQAMGVKTIFTLHGGHLDSALHAAVKAGIKLVDTRHEQAAGLAAMGWARVTGDVGVVMVTAGGGVTNVVTAVANAFADCVGMVIIGGAPPLRDYDSLPVNSGYDQLTVMAGITKWAHRVTHIEQLPELVARAFHIAREGRPGPVYLDLPSDVLFALVNEDTVSYPKYGRKIAPPAPASYAVEQALQLLRQAKRPVILAGGGVVYSGAATLLQQFVERSGIPILTNNKSRGTLPTDHPLWGRGFSSIAANAARGGGQPDVVMLLGARLGIYTGGRRTSLIPTDATVIQVDIKAEEIGRLREIDLGITADCREMLIGLIQHDDLSPWPDRSEWSKSLVPATPSKRNNEDVSQDTLPTPAVAAAVIAASVPSNAILVTDGGETPAWLDAVAPSLSPNRWLGHGYLGLCGEGMPLAVGAQVAKPESRVICFTGDGSVGFNFAEFDTMVRHNLPIVVIVNNDAQWGMSAHGQDLAFGAGNRMVSELLRTRYDQAAAGFGAYGEFVERLEDLGPAIERALESRRPACINVATDATAIAPVTRRLLGLAAEGLVGPNGKARVPYADILEI
ncbi:thiamine pyrophosphate-binding protein [Burkholderia sp. PU8-34]